MPDNFIAFAQDGHICQTKNNELKYENNIPIMDYI